MDELVLVSPHFSPSRSYEEWHRDLVGDKTLGLRELPQSWTPPFLVITTLAHKRWKEQQQFGASDLVSILDWVFANTGLEKHIATLCSGPLNSLIVRSSATSETLRDRGKYESRRCEGTVEAVWAAVSYVWTQTEGVMPPTESADSVDVAVIVQPYVRTLAAGHLSNERRVSRAKTYWVCESDVVADGAATRPMRFRVSIVDEPHQPVELSCESAQELLVKLKTIAALSSSSKERYHYEWVWDGHRVWIVQRDKEEKYTESRPGSAWIAQPETDGPRTLARFVAEPKATHAWPKLECVGTFRTCGLLAPRL